MTILKVEKLCKSYPAFSLQDVSFCVEEGSIMGLIGRNGAGKTTTLKTILQLAKADSGSVYFAGEDTQDVSKLRAGAGYVSGDLCYYPRKRLSQLTDATRRFYPGWDEARYRSLLTRFCLREQARVCELSSGMKVKYQLACALSHGARLLVLDEPTSGLDPVSRDDLLELLRTLCEREGVSVLFSTHITSDLEACADHITYLSSGRVAASCALAEFTAPWRRVSGDDGALTEDLRRQLRGLRVHGGRFEGLIPEASASAFAPFRVEKTDLQTVMVYLEREAME